MGREGGKEWGVSERDNLYVNFLSTDLRPKTPKIVGAAQAGGERQELNPDLSYG